MPKATPFLGWVVGSAGVILAYSAVKNKGPFSVLQTTLGAPGAAITPIQTQFGPGTAAATGAAAPVDMSGGGATATIAPGSQNIVQAGSGSDVARAQALQARKIQPQLTSIPGGGQMDVIAAASLNKVIAAFGHPIPNVGTFRSYAQQAAGYAASPGRFAPPGHSLHEVGLAIDVANSVTGGLDNPALVAAFQNNGWYRRGKIINGRPEPWHWTYGVPG